MNISWLDIGENISLEVINKIECSIGIKFPDTYIKLIRYHNGGTPLKDSFKYFDQFHLKEMRSGIGVFIILQENDFQSVYSLFKEPPEFFPDGLVAFAEDGGGDFMCFDYRKGWDLIDPPIVYWSHESDIDKSVSFIANNFEEFINMLEEPEDFEF